MRRSLFGMLVVAGACGLAWGGEKPEAGPGISIEGIEATVLWEHGEQGGPLLQVGRVKVKNGGAAVALRARVYLDGQAVRTEAAGTVPEGESSVVFRVPDAGRPTPLTVELVGDKDGRLVATHQVMWQPQRKHTLYCVFYSHGGIGFGNYPHRIRHSVRHATIVRALENCQATDGKPADEQFRYIIESSESVTSFLNSYPSMADELAKRLRSGQIEMSALHNVANTEQLGRECLARLFYLSDRHLRDMLDTPACRSALMNDVVGVTWPMVTYCQAADVPYLFHGYNRCAACMQPANGEPVFWWQGPGSDPSRVLVRSCSYCLHIDTLAKVDEAEIERAIGLFMGQSSRVGPFADESSRREAGLYMERAWPLDAILIQNGGDYEFTTCEMLEKMNAWNRKYAYPRLVKSTFEMFFQAAKDEMQVRGIKTFKGDSNNQWADEDASHAWLLGLCRRLNEAVPTAEKYSTIASTLTPGGYPWLDIYQAYHRLMLYYEHGGGATTAGKGSHRPGAQHYETELREHREVGTDAEHFCNRAMENGLQRLAGAIQADGPQTVVVFNALSRVRTDTVRFTMPGVKGALRLVDLVTGRAEPVGAMGKDEFVFVARDVPSLGYKAYRAERTTEGAASEGEGSQVLENRFYRIEFDTASGAIRSLRDREFDVELVDPSAPYKLGEYVYEQFETPSFEKGATWRRPTSARLQFSRGPVAQVMSAEIQAAGARRLTERVTIYDDVKRVDFAMFLDKAPSGRRITDHGMGTAKGKEGVYVALPLQVPDFQIRHELPGAVIEPIRQQFVGSCTAFYTIQHFTDVANSRFGVTVSSVEAPLVEYGRPRSCPIKHSIDGEGDFESKLVNPANSHVYLYFMNNMFDTAVRIDQRGPHEFHWSLRSHPGDWRKGQADEFGWDVRNPLQARIIAGEQQGSLPKAAHSFFGIDRPNVACTTIKPAESNGAGFILRLVETQGVATTAAVSMPFCGPIDSVQETNLVEEDRTEAMALDSQGRIQVKMDPFGVKTLRVRCHAACRPAVVAQVEAKPVSDMEVALSWQADPSAGGEVSHYNVYRGDRADFRPSLAGLVGRAPTASWVDRPQLNFGGWLNNRLEPRTTYYYRVAAVDRWKNEGPVSEPVSATTLSSDEKSAVPLPVVGLTAVHVSEVAPHNYINLIFRTNCESDIVRYNVHRSTERGFTPSDANRIGTVDPNEIIPAKTGYGNTPVDCRTGEYDHLMFADLQTKPGTTYFYRVCAIDAVGQKGPFSEEAAGATGTVPTTVDLESCSFVGDNGPEKAIDGDPRTAFVSLPYGGGTKEKPRWTQISVMFPRRTTIAGVKIVSGPGALLPSVYHLQRCNNGDWNSIGDIRSPKGESATLRLKAPVELEALRLLVMAKELSQSEDPRQNASLRIAEILLMLPDGKEVAIGECFGAGKKGG